jgi:hypothetical protein
MQSQISKKTSGKDLTAFQTILDFVTNLQDFFGNTKHSAVRPLNLYHRLISKMSFKDDELILKHIEVFKDFCVRNREQIREQNIKLAIAKIIFSDRIYIDMEYIFKKADDDTTKVIWEYILAISAYVDPENKTKELLKSLKEKSGEGDFLANMIETIGTQMNSSDGNMDNPMAMVGSLMNSDMLKTMMGSMNENLDNGNLDLGKLMGAMSGIVENVKGEIEKSDDPMLKSMMSMIQLPQMPTPDESHPLLTDNSLGKESDNSL